MISKAFDYRVISYRTTAGRESWHTELLGMVIVTFNFLFYAIPSLLWQNESWPNLENWKITLDYICILVFTAWTVLSRYIRRWYCSIPHSWLTPWNQYSRTFLLNLSEKSHMYSRSVSDLPVWLYSDRLERRIRSRDGCTRTWMCPWYPSDTSGRSQGNFL